MHEKIYTKYKLTKEISREDKVKTITIFAKISEGKITIENKYKEQEIVFLKSKPEEARAVCELIIEATNL